MNYRIRRKTFEEFKVGDEIVSGARTITVTDVINYTLSCFYIGMAGRRLSDNRRIPEFLTILIFI